MKPYLVDVPVKIDIWTRPVCQERQFNVIKEARPSVLFIQSDGGRNEEEWKLIRQNREMIENGIDWDCQVYKLYEDENLGMYTKGRKTNQFVWTKVDRCIFLEDDLVPAVSFFSFCAELLEKYKDDERIECICGCNYIGVYDECDSDYFFSRRGSIWGFATWKRVCTGLNIKDYANSEYVRNTLLRNAEFDRYTYDRIKAYGENEVYEGHVPSMEFWFDCLVSLQHKLQIVPKKNMVSNIGCDENATHAVSYKMLPHGIRRVFNMETYELNEPINHPRNVFPDLNYEKKRNRVLAYNMPLRTFARKVERQILLIRYRGLKVFFRQIGIIVKRIWMRKTNQKIEK